MAKVAFELKDSVEDFNGATASLSDGKTFEIGEALKAGKGKIVLDPVPSFPDGMDDEARQKEYDRATADERKVEILDALDDFKRAAVGETAAASKAASGAGDKPKQGGQS